MVFVKIEKLQTGMEGIAEMSGIYIKGMEMPKSRSRWVVIYPDGKVDYSDKTDEWETLDKGAISVPEHGRLGDLDAAVEKLKRLREYHSDDSRSGVFIAHGISQCIEVLTGKEVPTIIPADVTDTKEGG